MNKQIKYYDFISQSKVLQSLFQLGFDLFFNSLRLILKILPYKRESVCVISLHKLGDSIFTFDAINSIKKFYGDDVYIICNVESEPIYELVHDKKYLLSVPKEYFHSGDRYLDRRARRLLRKLNPKVIIDLTGVMTSASLIFNSGAKQIIGFNRKIFRSIYTNFTEFNLGNHSREIYTNAIKEIIPIVEFNYTPIYTQDSNRILIAPFAGWISKEWSLMKFIELAERLNEKYDVCFIFDNRKLEENVVSYLSDKEIKFLQTRTVKELINEIKDCKMLIGNDSGPIQIAALFGKYTFSIYGPTNPKFHLPKGNRHFYVQKTLPCTPKASERLCFTDGGKNGCPSFECLRTLRVEEVYNAILNLLLEFKSS
jgi:ADP-heptose:LPS heptosyltransferase